MGKKAAKSTKKFAASGQLKKTIEARRKHQQIRQKVEGRKGQKNGKSKTRLEAREEKDSDQDVENEPTTKRWTSRTLFFFVC
jgi:nucleolar complex protein 2